MSWRAQNRSKDAKTPSAGPAMSEKPELRFMPGPAIAWGRMGIAWGRMGPHGAHGAAWAMGPHGAHGPAWG
jgi:hypothetical protein